MGILLFHSVYLLKKSYLNAIAALKRTTNVKAELYSLLMPWSYSSCLHHGIILNHLAMNSSSEYSITGVSEQLCVGCKGQVCTLLFTTNTQFCFSNEAFFYLVFEHCWQPKESLFCVLLCMCSEGYLIPREC